jgi:uncharacterized glyoxalase superfamily protein PhnB/ubiquinone/menaquinone biosynthesis C-methylase UbiE
MSHIASVVLTIVGVSVVLAQCRKPMGWPGRFFAWSMNRSHSSLTGWGLTHVVIGKRDTALDVGCGGGRTVQKLATIATDGKVCGIDYSEASVRTSRSANRQAIQAGRVEIQRASVSQLPFPDGMFDLVTAVETHYYWPDLTADMCEILRVLKPGGKLLMIAEAYKGSRYDIVYGVVMKALRAAYLTAEEHRQLFERAGYSAIEVFEERSKGWICVAATKNQHERELLTGVATISRTEEAMIVNRSAPRATVVPVLVYEDVSKAIDWLCNTFGFKERLRAGAPGGRVTHSQLDIGDGAVMLGLQGGEFRSPRPNEVTQYVTVHVSSIDEHFEHTRQCGARILKSPANMPFGERQYTVEDPGGHRWTFSESIEDVALEKWGATPARNT